ncbi:MAG: MaoC family dehydratase [Hyphomicrobiales bacterium]|nr:MaoC family dehydratase [Hyphomicrobiales bacterium]
MVQTPNQPLALTDLRYGDVEPGDWFDTPRRRITAADIDNFAALTGDKFEIHMSDEAAQAQGFPSRVAHGLLVLSIVDGLKNQSEARFDAVASLSWDSSFRRPVLIGDTLFARVTVKSKRRTRNPERGIFELDFAVFNQQDETVQSGTNTLMVKC